MTRRMELCVTSTLGTSRCSPPSSAMPSGPRRTAEPSAWRRGSAPPPRPRAALRSRPRPQRGLKEEEQGPWWWGRRWKMVTPLLLRVRPRLGKVLTLALAIIPCPRHHPLHSHNSHGSLLLCCSFGIVAGDGSLVPVARTDQTINPSVITLR